SNAEKKQVGNYSSTKVICQLHCFSVESAVLSVGKPANAWEEGDEVILITCLLENPDLDLINGTVYGKLQTFKNELYVILIPGKIVVKSISSCRLDFRFSPLI
ncbi:hypothetical protein Taro_051280, partial [Colocasia esculenta]|nr:hypothetical protein [Colocasia esculenta]